jgi:hypothetical protein
LEIRMRVRFWRVALLSPALVAQAACGAGWHQISLGPNGELEPRQQVQVWSGGAPHQWHGVSWSADSVNGRDFLTPLDCDTCAAVGLARERVDSVRVGNPSSGLWKTAGLVVGGALAVGVAACLTFQDCQSGN